jgi:hypothetical protein
MMRMHAIVLLLLSSLLMTLMMPMMQTSMKVGDAFHISVAEGYSSDRHTSYPIHWTAMHCLLQPIVALLTGCSQQYADLVFNYRYIREHNVRPLRVVIGFQCLSFRSVYANLAPSVNRAGALYPALDSVIVLYHRTAWEDLYKPIMQFLTQLFCYVVFVNFRRVLSMPSASGRRVL